MKIYAEAIITEVVKEMLDMATVDKLREMNVKVMADKFLWQREQPGILNLSFEERFGMLVDAEWLERRGRRESRLIRQAKFRFPASIEDIDYHEKRGITKADIIRLSDCLYIKRKQNLIITGPTGVGKTFIVCALGRCACQQELAVYYTRMNDLFLSFEQAHLTNSFALLKKRLLKVPLLILDDWGIKPFTNIESHEIGELVELRYGRASTIISSQVPSTSWHELFPDPTSGEATLDRLIHNAFNYNLSGESMRKILAMQQFAIEPESG